MVFCSIISALSTRHGQGRMELATYYGLPSSFQSWTMSSCSLCLISSKLCFSTFSLGVSQRRTYPLLLSFKLHLNSHIWAGCLTDFVLLIARAFSSQDSNSWNAMVVQNSLWSIVWEEQVMPCVFIWWYTYFSNKEKLGQRLVLNAHAVAWRALSHFG